VWLAFGAVAVPIVVERMDWALLVYALLSLSLVRMVPVALALAGSDFGRTTALFIGWFGPRGLASLVFALLALEEIGPGADDAVAVIAVTVFLSVLAHGISAAPLAARYGRSAAARVPEPGGPVADLPVRGLPRPRDGARIDDPGPTEASREQ
jgi:NhaP-type Na+/H+ or K+/H+ antiporter